MSNTCLFLCRRLYTGMPDTSAMHHLGMASPPSDCNLAPVRNETGDQQPVTPQSELFDLEESELICREVASRTITAETERDEVVDSPLAPHYKFSATSDRLVEGAGRHVRTASESLNLSLFRISISSDGGEDVQDHAQSDLKSGVAKDWIQDFECQPGFVPRLDSQRVPARERTGVTTAPRHAKHISSQTSPPRKKRTASSVGSQSLTPTRFGAEQRPYTDLLALETPIYLETPDSSKLSPGSSRDPSEVSDAGLQLGLRSKHTRSSLSECTKSISARRSSARQSPDKSSKYELQKKILAAFQRTQNSHGQSQEFLPNGDLYTLINPLTVGQELRSQMGHMHTPSKIDSFTKQICGESSVLWCGKSKIKTYRKVFALLVLVGVTASAPFFLEEDISDLDLPLNLSPREDDGETPEAPSPFHRLEDLWSPVQMRTFQDYQWKMLAPFFARGKHGDVMHYPLKEEHILPFMARNEEEKKAEKKGGFAKVIMVRIHGAHHDFHRSKNHELGFAVKQQLHMDDRETFEKEIAVLKKFSGEGRGHKHIISLLATFEQFDKLNLLFYRADGDLFAFWDRVESETKLTHAQVLWAAEQCEGLVEALSKVHKHLTFTKKPEGLSEKAARTMSESCSIQNYQSAHKRVRFDQEDHGTRKVALPRSQSDSAVNLNSTSSGDYGTVEKQYGRHGDINPGNILWYQDCDALEGCHGGTLKIADFGQTEFNSLKSRTARRDVANTLTYRPPECDKLGHSDLPVIRQRYDIWCLGCVFLEFVTWMLGGASLQKKFAKDRLTFDIFQGHKTDTFFQAKRNLETDCYDVSLKPEVEKSITQLHEHPNCSEFCHDFLILIQCDMLVVDSSKRSTCDVVLKNLHKMLRRCRMDGEYAIKASPWAATPLQGSASQPMAVKIEKATTPPMESESEDPNQAAHAIYPRTRYAKRNERRNHRNHRGEFKAAQRSQMNRRVA